MCLHGLINQIPRERDKTYIYTLADSNINHRSVHINHHLKIVDAYIKMNCPKNFDVERIFGIYEPDIYTIDKSHLLCVEIQLTQISNKKMQQKINQFMAEFDKHKSRVFYLMSDYKYTKLTIDDRFQLIQDDLPKETPIIYKQNVPAKPTVVNKINQPIRVSIAK